MHVYFDSKGNKCALREGLDEYNAYKLASRYFNNIVPPTYLVVIDDVQYSCQPIIDAKTANESQDNLLNSVRHQSSVYDIANLICLDIVAKNHDRHSNNWLLSSTNRIYAIDTTFTDEFVPLTIAFRPAWRTLLLDDPDYSFFFLNSIRTILITYSALTSTVDYLPYVDAVTHLYNNLVANPPRGI